MSIFDNKYPYSDFHELNLDWFLEQFKELVDDWDTFKTTITTQWNDYQTNLNKEWSDYQTSLNKEWSDYQTALIARMVTVEEEMATLKKFVEDYFESTHFKEVVSDKLDEMLESGALATLIYSAYNIRMYNNVEEMKADTNLLNNFNVRTCGYYSVNDGGGAFYKIYDEAPSGHYETLSNGKYAQLQIYDFVNPKMLGAKGDGNNDDTIAIQSAVSLNKPIKFDVGNYLITSTITLNSNSKIYMKGNIQSLLAKTISDFPNTLYTIITTNSDIIMFNLTNGCEICGGLIYAPNVTKAINIDVGLNEIQNINMKTAILGNRTSNSTAIYFDCSTGTTGYITFSTFNNAIGSFYNAYFANRPSNINLPWITVINFYGVLCDNYKAFTHNFTNFGYAFGGSTYGFILCGSNVWENNTTALVDLLGDTLNVEIKTSDIGSTHKQYYAIDFSHMVSGIVKYQNKLSSICLNTKPQFSYINDGYTSVTLDNGTLYYSISNLKMDIIYKGTIPPGGFSYALNQMASIYNQYRYITEDKKVGVRILTNFGTITFINDNTYEVSVDFHTQFVGTPT